MLKLLIASLLGVVFASAQSLGSQARFFSLLIMPPTTTQVRILKAVVDKEVGRGQLTWPDPMTEGEPQRFYYRVAKSSYLDLLKGLPSTDRIEVKDIQVSRSMSASLIADQDEFKIIPLQDSPEQIVLDDEVTEWQWEVTPKQWGHHWIHLTVGAVFNTGGGSVKKFTVDDRNVKITISPSYELSQGYRRIFEIAALLVAALSGTITLLLSPMLRLRARRRQEAKKKRIIAP
jgi:hypothetical protein